MPEPLRYARKFDRHARMATIRSFVRQGVSKLGGSEDDKFAFQLATDEAATNVFEHAYAGQDGKILVTVSRESDALVVCIRDWGRPFDPDRVPPPDLDAPLEERPEGGLGLFLIRKFTDDVSYAFDPVQGNTITMRRRLNRK